MSVLTPDLLDRAAAIQEARGLCKYAYHEHRTGTVCILGAIAIARGHEPHDWPEDDALDAFIEEPLGELSVLLGCDPVLPQDQEGATATDVAGMLREAAAAMRVPSRRPDQSVTMEG